MKYRIVSNGKAFRVQRWIWFCPIWLYVRRMLPYGAWSYEEWDSKEQAQWWIDQQLSEHEIASRPWKPL